MILRTIFQITTSGYFWLVDQRFRNRDIFQALIYSNRWSVNWDYLFNSSGFQLGFSDEAEDGYYFNFYVTLQTEIVKDRLVIEISFTNVNRVKINPELESQAPEID